MRVAVAFLALVLTTAVAQAADPIYLDQLIETPADTLEAQLGKMKREGCFQIGADRFLFITMDKKDRKPWRVVLSSIEPCKKPVQVAEMDVRERNGVNIGDTTPNVL